MIQTHNSERNRRYCELRRDDGVCELNEWECGYRTDFERCSERTLYGNRKRRMVAVLAVCSLLAGCVSPPEKDKFLEIYNDPYIRGRNDCSNKTGQYVRHLLSKGFQAEAMVTYHAICRVLINGEWVYVDVTKGTIYKSELPFELMFYRQVRNQEVMEEAGWR